MDLMEWLRKQLEEADADLLREMMRLMAGMLMDAEVAAICGAEYRERSEERTNSRNGHRQRPWDTRVGSIDLAIPKLREGSYFPGTWSAPSWPSNTTSGWSAAGT
jgi:transposase-like protein